MEAILGMRQKKEYYRQIVKSERQEIISDKYSTRWNSGKLNFGGQQHFEPQIKDTK